MAREGEPQVRPREGRVSDEGVLVSEANESTEEPVFSGANEEVGEDEVRLRLCGVGNCLQQFKAPL
ncbi:hypothetical protein [Haladaptatus litoreus]|uniref:hypothetical protein n=1 Tax=Haladaptatus litoreus TaxID=553468 RepID=UPI0011156062|nr:hypothetical protein [Haladaptatus litoreus]